MSNLGGQLPSASQVSFDNLDGNLAAPRIIHANPFGGPHTLADEAACRAAIEKAREELGPDASYGAVILRSAQIRQGN